MQTLNRLLQLTNTAAMLTDLTRQKHTYTLPVMKAADTFYVHADRAALRIVRWERPQAEITIETRPPMGWRTATDYDEHGVYVVAIQRTGFGSVASAVINALVPRHMHLTLRMQDSLVTFDHLTGTLHIPPTGAPLPTGDE